MGVFYTIATYCVTVNLAILLEIHGTDGVVESMMCLSAPFGAWSRDTVQGLSHTQILGHHPGLGPDLYIPISIISLSWFKKEDILPCPE